MEATDVFKIRSIFPLFIIILRFVCLIEGDSLLKRENVFILKAGDSEPQQSNRDTFGNITCSSADDCAAVNGSLCSEFLCTCPDTIPIFVNVTAQEGYCLKALNLTDKDCTYSQQCNYDNGLCQKNTCICADRYFEKEGACEKIKKSPLIPIIVGSVIAVSIVGTLVAYVWMTRKKTRDN